MLSTWTYKINDKEYGPFGLKTIKKLLEEGKLTPDHMVKGRASGNKWIKICEMLELPEAGFVKPKQLQQVTRKAGGESLRCPKCKKSFPADSVKAIHFEGTLSYICPKCNGPLISSKDKRKKKTKTIWRLQKSDKLGLMFGPIPIGALFFLAIIYAIYHFFGDAIVKYYKALF